MSQKGGKIPSIDLRLNHVPDQTRRIHLMGICGTGMASLAGILKERGFIVEGSDRGIYPPMSTFLEAMDIPVFEGYSPGNLSPPPDLVVVGNVITRDNPEAVELVNLGLPYVSFPQALRELGFNGKRPIVVTGTHGKTTTSSLAAWSLEKGGMDPGFMIGGLPANFQTSFKLGEGLYFVLEGDEYDTAFFDKGPKFLHYAPWAAILTGIEFDHADIYSDIDQIRESFRRFINLIPPNGILIVNNDDPVAASEAGRARCPVLTYGLSGKTDWSAVDIARGDDLTRAVILKEDVPYTDIATPLYGRHNILNLLSTVALADFLEISPETIRLAAASFRGVTRRQEIIGEREGILVIDDFAHHPSAVRETLKAVREKYTGRRLLAVFEPRSNSSRRKIFQESYAESFMNADLALIPEPGNVEKVPLSERFSSQRLAADLTTRGIEAYAFSDTEKLLESLIKLVKRNDIVLFMSNGGFDNLPRRLYENIGTPRGPKPKRR